MKWSGAGRISAFRNHGPSIQFRVGGITFRPPCLLPFWPAFLPPFFPPFLEAQRFSFLPRPEPLFLPPPDSLFTVAQARAFASLLEDPTIFVALFVVFGLSFFAYRFKHSYLHEALSILLLLLVWPGDFLK